MGTNSKPKFHGHAEDKGIRHPYIKRGTTRLTGKVERDHTARTARSSISFLTTRMVSISKQSSMNGSAFITSTDHTGLKRKNTSGSTQGKTIINPQIVTRVTQLTAVFDSHHFHKCTNLETIKQKGFGGREWESNPPGTSDAPQRF